MLDYGLSNAIFETPNYHAFTFIWTFGIGILATFEPPIASTFMIIMIIK
jgi:hypothetical protein